MATSPRRFCLRCGRVFQSWLGLEAHIRDHAPVRPAGAPAPTLR